MGETTGISWAHATLNFWIGCTKVGVACDFCYAETWGNRFGVAWGVGEPRRPTVGNRAKALKLDRLAVASRAPFYCFSNSLSDIFDPEVPIEWLGEAFEDMRAAPNVTFLLLTKRPGRIVTRATLAGGLPPNAAIGCTVVTQEEGNRDVPKLIKAKHALDPVLAFLSMEPLMGAVDLTRIDTMAFRQAEVLNALDGRTAGLFGDPGPRVPRIDWVVIGGESGPHARPTHPAWERRIAHACAGHGVPFHKKQTGEWVHQSQVLDLTFIPGVNTLSQREFFKWEDGTISEKLGKKNTGRLLDGVLHDAMPVLP